MQPKARLRAEAPQLYQRIDSSLKFRQKLYLAAIDHHFSGMLEGHRDAVADPGLDLPQPPVWPVRVAHQHPRLEKIV